MAQYNTITYGFKVGAPIAIDDRLVLTKEQMRQISDDRMPNNYLAVCSDDGKIYLYNKKNEFLENETGRFRLFDEGTVKDVQYNGVSVVDASTKVANIELPLTVVDNKLCCIYDDTL